MKLIQEFENLNESGDEGKIQFEGGSYIMSPRLKDISKLIDEHDIPGLICKINKPVEKIPCSYFISEKDTTVKAKCSIYIQKNPDGFDIEFYLDSFEVDGNPVHHSYGYECKIGKLTLLTHGRG
jgi:hypothetical protein